MSRPPGEELQQVLWSLVKTKLTLAGLAPGSNPLAIQAELDRIATEINQEVEQFELLPLITLVRLPTGEIDMNFACVTCAGAFPVLGKRQCEDCFAKETH